MDKAKSYSELTMGRSLGSALLVILWVLGIKIATGFWAVFFAIFTPYGWYLLLRQSPSSLE